MKPRILLKPTPNEKGEYKAAYRCCNGVQDVVVASTLVKAFKLALCEVRIRERFYCPHVEVA